MIELINFIKILKWIFIKKLNVNTDTLSKSLINK
jgi:hypothetical protein